MSQNKGRHWASTRVCSGQGHMKAMNLYKRRHWVSTREISWPIQIKGSGLIQAFTRKAVGQYKPVDGKAVGQYKGGQLTSTRERQLAMTREGTRPIQEKPAG